MIRVPCLFLAVAFDLGAAVPGASAATNAAALALLP